MSPRTGQSRQAELIGELRALGIAAGGDHERITLDLPEARRLIAQLRDLQAQAADLQTFEDRGYL